MITTLFVSAQQTPPAAEVKSPETPPPAAATAPPAKPPAETDTKTTPPTAKTDPPEESPETPPAERRGPTDPAELAAFIDGIMAAQMKEKHVAGATISVVVDNRPFFSKGYGYANVAAKEPVDPDKTMFRIGSVSKLFTWTAVMQLAEEGKLDLDADINTYLADFKIPPTYPEPITLEHLMTHTPGFEDHILELFARSPDKLEPLGTLLARQLPARVRPPGGLASYSNHGTAIAGYIVAEVSGMPWEGYIEQKILQPLGMEHTLARQPALDKMPADMSKGYAFERGRYEEKGFEYVPLAPAGAVSASAGDMARFMIAHMQDGRYDSTQILKDETARRMRQLLFTHDERLDGMAYGFFRLTYNGEQIVHHGGDTRWFHSFLVMLPERKTGFFVSYNTDTAGAARERLLTAFLDRYFPAAEPPEKKDQEKEPASGQPGSLKRFTGSYGALRRSYTSIAKLAALMGVVKISADGGQLVVSGLGSDPTRFVEIEPLLFREVDGWETIAFRQDAQGHITHLFVGKLPIVAFEKLAFGETPMFAMLLVGACALVFLSAVIGWPWAAFIAWGVPRETTVGSRLAGWLGWIVSLAALVWLGAALLFMREPEELAYGVPPLVEAMLWAAPAIAVLVAAVLLAALAAWLRGYWRFSGRLHYTCVLAAGLAFVWFLHHWNLLRLPIWPA
ncbi:MAG: serine hydrolase domain-containing protein [Pirellulales bacterium]